MVVMKRVKYAKLMAPVRGPSAHRPKWRAVGIAEVRPSLSIVCVNVGIFREGTNMKPILIALVATIGLASAQAANAQEALAKSSGCLNCHTADTKKIGPSFKSI